MDDNTKISICAYFISKFDEKIDKKATWHLGYQTPKKAMDDISQKFGKHDNFLKLRRDEFDPLTGSYRRGRVGRPPRSGVKKMHEDLKALTFEELAELVTGVLNGDAISYRDNKYSVDADNELGDKPHEVYNSSAPEGKKKEIYTTIYERNDKNRRDCIRIHGTVCKACGFDFLKVYGQWGEGFIEVHHLKPLYSLTEEIVVNPQTDLVPVCSNCHRMIHRKKNQILTVEEVKAKIEGT